jgi:predicted nucleic acid-binding protein
MNFVPVEDIEPFKDSAKNIMKDIDPDDSPFLALAIMLNALSGAMIVISRSKKSLQSSPQKRS